MNLEQNAKDFCAKSFQCAYLCDDATRILDKVEHSRSTIFNYKILTFFQILYTLIKNILLSFLI